MNETEYIERLAFIEAVKDIPMWGSAAVMLADSIPSADVAPVVHGQWISWENAENYVPSPDRHECSVCHDAAQVLINGFELLSEYCPNCGAKMDESMSIYK